MTQLPKLTVCWDYRTQAVRFAWDSRGLGNARYVYIIPLRIQTDQTDGTQLLSADPSIKRICLDLQVEPCGETGKYNMEIPAVFSANPTTMFFLIYSSENSNMPSRHMLAETIRNREDLIVSAVVGHAMLEYTVKYKKIDSKVCFAWFIIRSDRDLDNRYINYMYQIEGKEIKLPLPQRIRNGKTKTSRFLLPAGASVQLIPAQENLLGVIELRKT